MTGTWHPRVTALLPTYNGAAFIQRTLDGLAAQTWDNLDILIGDDCSTDTTPAIIAAFAATHPNVRILTRTANLGWLRNSNDLMARAEGELLFFAFHDDVVDLNYVSLLVEALRERPEAIVAYTDMEVIEPDGRSRVERFRALTNRHTPLRRGIRMLDLPTHWWVPQRGLFRRAAFARIGGIKPNAAGEFSADWNWLLHMALLGDFVRVEAVACHKYYKTTSLSRSWTRTAFEKRALRVAGQREIWGSSLPLHQRLALLAYSRLRLTWLRKRLPRRLRARLARLLGG